MASPDKLESDYQRFIKNIEQMAASDIEKIKADLNALRNQAAQYGGAA